MDRTLVRACHTGVARCGEAWDITGANLMRALLVAILFSGPAVVHAQAPAAAGPSTTITSVEVRQGPVLVITAAAPLPPPKVGTLHDPDRIYVDLAGVSSRALTAAGDADLVAAVRVAQHSLDPLVARIVIDLTRPCRYSVNTSQRDAGQIEISLAPATAGTTPAPVPSNPPKLRAGNAATRRYVASVEQALSKTVALRNVLQDIDRKTVVSAEWLQSAQQELGRLRGTIDALRPPAAVAEAHDLLKSAIGFAATALNLAASSTVEMPGNASSAAAGALMMLDRADVELQSVGSSESAPEVVNASGRW